MQTPALVKSADAAPVVAPNLIDRVYEFNRIGQVRPPAGFDADRVGFYTGMQLEELAEKLESIAAGCISLVQTHELSKFAEQLQALGRDFKAGKFMGAVLRSEREALLDADVDILVVSAGSLVYQTRKFREAVEHVLERNDAKFVNGIAQRDVNGKIVKPEGWTPPDLSPFVEIPID